MTRRVVAAVLILVSLALLTVYLREDDEGGLHAAQRLGLSIVHPFEVAGERVSRPFRDAYGYVSDLVANKADRDALERQVAELQQQAALAQAAIAENEQLRTVAGLVDGPRFSDYEKVATSILVQPPDPFHQRIIVAAGSDRGIAVDDPVITGDGALVGKVTSVTSSSAQVTLLTDQSLEVSAEVLGTNARGLVEASQSGSGLILDRVEKDEVVKPGSTVVTAGWQVGELSSLYPRWIRIGTVTSVSRRDIDVYQTIQVEPTVDFDKLSQVVVLVKR